MSSRDSLLYIGVNPQIVFDAASQELDELEEIMQKMKVAYDSK